MNIIHRVYRWVVFKVGDTRWCGWKHFPFIVTWDAVTPRVTGDEMAVVARDIRKGDVLVMRADGYASNLGIGGGMIHAALVVDDAGHIVEALSDDEGGVVKRHVLDSIRHADRLVVLRPKLTDMEINNAVDEALKLVGLRYDIYFKFDVDEQRAQLAAGNREAVRVCCTEVAYFAYFNHIVHLGLYRQVKRTFAQRVLRLLGLTVGEQVLTADDILAAEGMVVMWLSAGATPAWFATVTDNERLLQKVMGFYRFKR
jgi:hypothetical protein